MQLSVVTLFPEMFTALTQWGISGRAVKQELVNLDFFNPRDFTTDKHRTVDDKPFGGGPGMLMKTEPLVAAINAAKQANRERSKDRKGANNGDIEDSKVVYLSPQGRRAKHEDIIRLAAKESLILVCGRYQGVDNRVIEYEIDEELSIGDFVLSGGELPAMVLIDAMIRFQPGALGDEDSARQDSFANGLLHCPEYTRPQEFRQKKVPDVLLRGDHGEIKNWRLKQSLGATWLKRPDLIEDLIAKKQLGQKETELLEQFISEHQKQ